MSGSDCGRWSGNENVKESESGRENEREKGSEGGRDLEVESDTGMEAVPLLIAQDATVLLVPEKVETGTGIGIGRERENTDTRIDIAHAPTHTGAKRRGPPEKDHLTHVRESARCLRRDGVRTRQSTQTGTTGRCLPPLTEPGTRIERDHCRTSGTDAHAPAPRSESLGRYERGGCEVDISKVFDLNILFSERMIEKYACWCKCVCFGFVCAIQC